MTETSYPKIALKGVEGLVFVRQNEIIYALANGNYTLIYLADGRMIKVLRKLKGVGELLSSDNFVRIHRSHLVNLSHVTRFNSDQTQSVLMSNGELLVVARNRKMAFIEKFTRI